ncbi:putative bifunctional diguanylate cyclase/phosphodiesterase [Sedimenticola hydrogenitrophicus]|uniref:putative bifunctional diguanylate cyclase/phosphodiesterase n=1 Tax=Sedimenticola hydrogenitrophicus TaxID=2967975 RepID=UPI0023B164EC|nr:bifunctional diguanylate cyclase/phosphodiesterase [Sedimenticola hydrogenitrophicus]
MRRMLKLHTIKSFMLVAALAGALVLFLGAYLVVSEVYDRSVRSDARTVSGILAGQTFDSMFQVMRRGWNREELEEFIEAMRQRFQDTPYSLEIYRGAIVEARFGTIEQPDPDPIIRQVFEQGQRLVTENDEGLRHVQPLTAREECLVCHKNASAGDVLGVIDLRQNLRPVLNQARSQFITSLSLIVPLMLAGALLVALLIHRRVDRSLGRVRDCVRKVNKVSDLARFDLQYEPAEFRELDEIQDEFNELATRLRAVAVDRELLEFEMRLMERFIITSEVVRDWREYVCQLLTEINEVLEAYMLFTVFKVEEETFDLEVFWRNQPAPHVQQVLERNVRAVLQRHPYFRGAAAIEVKHNVADPSRELTYLANEDIELQSKSLFVDMPKIGGIVGIGVQAGLGRDPIRLLVAESILSTLLNVVGSVKAIYKYTKELEYYATRDPLTDLYNQRVFWELIDYEISRCERKPERLGLLVIDLDNFKNINDNYGHAFGDRFLQAFADLLKRHFRQGDLVARYGGDEFVVLLADTPENQAYSVALRLVEESRKLAIAADDGQPVHATISIGIALYPDHAEPSRDLFMIADNMMYRAKQGGKNRVKLAGSEEVAEVYRAIGAQSFTILAALENKRFIPYFQPIVASPDAGEFAFEVLSRMLGEEGEIIVAGEFIEVAERMGVVHQIDYQIMDRAFERVSHQGYSGLLFVNLSPKALILSEFVPEVMRLVDHHGIRPEQIVFEITERETVRNLTLLQRFVSELKLRGFQFAIDDFGSGFSSFHYLKHFPIDFVKIDGEFIVNLMHDRHDQIFVRHISAMAQELGIRTVAEFVESDEVLTEVRNAGIGYAQGYAIGRPGPELE